MENLGLSAELYHAGACTSALYIGRVATTANTNNTNPSPSDIPNSGLVGS